jgi:SAM-dependent methyltransferase
MWLEEAQSIPILPKMNVENFYDSYWASGLHVSPEWDERRFRSTLAPLIGKERVLDYGCGMGDAYQRQLVKAVGSYVGADVGELALDATRKKGLPALKIDPDKGSTDSATHAFDGAVCSEVFEHLFDPLQSAREICRVLKPGGVLVCTVPNFGYHPWRLLAFLRAQVPSEPENPRLNRYNGVHIRFFSKLMLKRLLRDAGFVDIKIGSYDDSSVWDIFHCAGHIAWISNFARDHFPNFLHLRFLQHVWPNVLAKRLRGIAYKPK